MSERTIFGPSGQLFRRMPQPRCVWWPSCKYYGISREITGPYVKYTDDTYAHAICNEHYAESVARAKTGDDSSEVWYNPDWYNHGLTPKDRY